ncbi:hypothetical protein CKM354_000727400 [Cercospora kikuchii]|uniref:Rhodopsin domain-containing protein n=1 Tax=Cercospora kikuchii TaxID=84275 RepID=A0A9P3CQT4_9PEZI|nr:uncharacterized protein CKM354_000727400 [Cercospora kikuchii]GIZ44065.1 hypothetical protein CKM354_000727400 [Cercospora kikuchii]
MRLAYDLLVFFAVTAQASRSWNLTAALELPPCVPACAQRILPEYNCTLLDETTLLPTDCYCASAGPLADKLSKCVLEECPTLAEALEGLKFQALGCDYPRDRNRGPVLLATAVSLFTITTLFLIARFLSRWPRLSGAGLSWDDGIVLACYIPVVGITIVAVRLVDYGSGKDSWMLPVENVMAVAKWFWAVLPIYLAAVFFTKLSLVVLYLRIWPSEPGCRSRFRIICWTIAAALVATALACIFSIIFACHPIRNSWRYADEAMGTCTHRVDAGIAYGALNATFDFIVIVLPIPRLLQLNVSARQKIGICSCFLVGLIATVCSLIRLTRLDGLYTGRNITWDYVDAGLWSLIEVYCSMICCCMPSMAGLIQRCWRSGPWTTNDSRQMPSFEMMSATEKERDSGLFAPGYRDMIPSPTKLLRKKTLSDSTLGDKPSPNVCEKEVGFVTYMPTAQLPPEK